MAVTDIKERYIPQEHSFYRDHYHQVLWVVMFILLLLLAAIGVVLYQMYERPLPSFAAYNPKSEQMELTPFEEPNLLSDTILRWASKAAITAYTFNFGDYNQQIQNARYYFTSDGWTDYLSSVKGLIDTIVQKQLYVNSVVAGTPVISNQGPLPGKDYAWRIQIPFLVTYQTGNAVISTNYLVILTIVRVPTSSNPEGIGIDQFVMIQK